MPLAPRLDLFLKFRYFSFMENHLDDRDVVLKGDELEGRKIDFVVCGGIAAIESPKLIRELRRYGAQVRVILSPAAENFVNPIVFEWASKNKVISQLSGSAEHISQADIVVIAPATLDFMAKMSLGLADSAAATLLQSRLERAPVVVIPSMHSSLLESPSFKEHAKRLSHLKGVTIVEGPKEEGKLKALAPEDAAIHTIRAFRKYFLKTPLRTLITLGGTRSYLDDVRYLGNFSTGRTGLDIALEFFKRGHEVEIIAAHTEVSIPNYLKTTKALEHREFEAALKKISNKPPDVWIQAAAILDFEATDTETKKRASDSAWNLKLKPTTKIIDQFSWPNCKKIAFKLESRLNEAELSSEVETWIRGKNIDLVVANRLEDVSSKKYRARIYDSKLKRWLPVDSRPMLGKILVQKSSEMFV